MIKRSLVALLLTWPLSTKAVPLMDLVDIEGIRGNQLIGYGLVVGLDGTGDKNQVRFTSQSVANMIKQFGINLPPNVDPKLKNVAAVTVTAEIPPSYSPGQTVDITVASLGDAKSLRGGQLLLTPLQGSMARPMPWPRALSSLVASMPPGRAAPAWRSTLPTAVACPTAPPSNG